jgi:hypothetical protein
MKLALVLDRFDRDRGGLEHWAWQWSRWLLDGGHSVHVLCSKGRDDMASDRFTLDEPRWWHGIWSLKMPTSFTTLASAGATM